jgi:hypothetical protein
VENVKKTKRKKKQQNVDGDVEGGEDDNKGGFNMFTEEQKNNVPSPEHDIIFKPPVRRNPKRHPLPSSRLMNFIPSHVLNLTGDSDVSR